MPNEPSTPTAILPGSILEQFGERYKIIEPLGAGGQGKTYLAQDKESAALVVVKKLRIDQASDWKVVELFEREGQALQSLSHPAIPAYHDAFHLNDECGEKRFFLVQEYVDGENFEQLLANGLRFDEAKARAFLLEMLDILHYLHTQKPPVIHRDIKPSNIMRRRKDDRLVLIDFGAAQTSFVDKTGGSTVIGTSGYMPLEQLTGRSVAATDLYGLAATTVHLLSGRHPADLPVENMALRFHNQVNVSDGLIAFLYQMLEPHAEDRFSSAAEAKKTLNSPVTMTLRRLRRSKNAPAKRPPVKSNHGFTRGDIAISIAFGMTAPAAFLGIFYFQEMVIQNSDVDILAVGICIFSISWFIGALVIGHLRVRRKRRIR